MGFDTHMIAGGRACSTSIPPTHPTITSQTSPHFAEALLLEPIGYVPPAEFEAAFQREEDPSYPARLKKPSLR
jgi:hypothetical protein